MFTEYDSAASVFVVTGVQATAKQANVGTITTLSGIQALVDSTPTGTGPMTNVHTFEVLKPVWQGAKPATLNGLEVPDLGNAGITTVRSIHVADILAGTNRYLLELGPSTPYMRLIGGGNPAADQTNLYLNEGGALRQVQVKDGASIGAGDRVAVLV
jgi:hypothetical protein